RGRDRAEPGGHGRARPRRRSLGVHGGLRGGRRPGHLARPAAFAGRSASRRSAAPPSGSRRARRRIRGTVASGHRVCRVSRVLAAGDWARAVYANDDAIRHYERALRTLAECQACAIETWAPRERLADLQGLTGRRAEALAHYESVRQETETAGDRAAAARLHR